MQTVPPPEDLPITFEVDRFKWGGIAIFSAILFIAAGYGLREAVINHWVPICFMVMTALGVIVGSIQCLPNATYIRLTTTDYEVRALFRSNFYKWDNVVEFGTMRMSRKTLFSRKNDYISILTKDQKLPIKGVIEPMGRDPQEMADFLNAMAQHYGQVEETT